MSQHILYHYDACPYCQKVRRAIAELNIADRIELRDTLKDPANRQALVALTQRTQVPCLVTHGKPMLESSDIVAYLYQQYGNGKRPAARGGL